MASRINPEYYCGEIPFRTELLYPDSPQSQDESFFLLDTLAEQTPDNEAVQHKIQWARQELQNNAHLLVRVKPSNDWVAR